MPSPREMVGRKFGRLTVVSQAAHKGVNRQWLCKCECGRERIVNGYNLRKGHTRSCGCFQKERAIETHTVHGQCQRGRRTRTYHSWDAMMERCYNRRNHRFKYYGGRGIIVSPRWHDFASFYQDMGNRPKGTTLGRIGDIGNYEPGNVRWMTQAEQTEIQVEKRLSVQT